MQTATENLADPGTGGVFAEALPENWQRALPLPCTVGVELAIHSYRFGDVLDLAPGRVLDTQWKVGRDLPLLVNAQLVAWVEFEVIGKHLAVRVAGLADDPGEPKAAGAGTDPYHSAGEEAQSHA